MKNFIIGFTVSFIVMAISLFLVGFMMFLLFPTFTILIYFLYVVIGSLIGALLHQILIRLFFKEVK